MRDCLFIKEAILSQASFTSINSSSDTNELPLETFSVELSYFHYPSQTAISDILLEDKSFGGKIALNFLMKTCLLISPFNAQSSSGSVDLRLYFSASNQVGFVWFTACLDRLNTSTVSFATARSLLLLVHRPSLWLSLQPQTRLSRDKPEYHQPLPVHPRARVRCTRLRDKVPRVNLFLNNEFLTSHDFYRAVVQCTASRTITGPRPTFEMFYIRNAIRKLHKLEVEISAGPMILRGSLK